MSDILDKKEMTEEDIKSEYITPALKSKWEGKFTMETAITDGKIVLRGNVGSRDKKRCKADYILYLNRANPIAIVEAKDNKHAVSYGMQQAKTYAQMLDIPFAYSSNGDAFQEYDFFAGKERTIALEDFPTQEELAERLKRGRKLTPEQEKIMEVPFYTGQNTNSPRYYQRIAINRTLDAIARGQNRLLLVMATGTGKTYTAFQIVYRLLESGMKRKILYLADRNVLVDQSIAQDFKPLAKSVCKIKVANADPTTITAYQVYFALYQQLVGDDGKEHYSKLFKPDFFDFIIVDECHRGSAKDASRWRKILEYFRSAAQLGMTATPKETEDVSNLAYFGEPVYTYSLKQGIEDGFLAPFKVIKITTNISDGWRPIAGQLDAFGKPVEDRVYTNKDFDYNIVLLDRTREVAEEITNYLRATDRMAKTIVFCPTEDAAERMRAELANQNSDMMKINPNYVVRITGSDEFGKGQLDYFISVNSAYPVIATTSELLSTGVDTKMTKLIVLDKIIGSMTEFKQTIGRGTRILEKYGKTHFTVMDFRNVTTLFADPDWDGPIETDPNYSPGGRRVRENDPPVTHNPREIPIVRSDGCRVKVILKTISVFDADGKLLKVENLIDYTRQSINGKFASLEDFIGKWSAEEKKERIADLLKEDGIDLEQIKAEENMSDVDDFDFICQLAYNRKPLTRKERADRVKKRGFLRKYGEAARNVLEALLDKYADSGISEIESTDTLRLQPFSAIGTPGKIADLFGGKDGYFAAVKELTEQIYSEQAG